MYRVSNDQRAKRSAERICQGLESCLADKPLDKIRVNDIYEKSRVSRATFYRLFDGINDVFLYECDTFFLDILHLLEGRSFGSKDEQALYCIHRWLLHETLIKALVQNNLNGIFYDAHMRNAALLKKFYSVPFDDENSFDYFVSILASICFASLSIYFQHGAQEPIDEVYHTVCRCMSAISANLND